MKKRVFSGTRATGRLHLGNYLGAVKGYIELQNDPDYDCVYMAVDVHTITTPFDAKTLPTATRDIIMDYLAAGLDPEKAIITKQSLVPEHIELAFLFSSVLTVARMQDLPTFKDKIRQHPENVTMALLNYPVLMASDILIYKAGLVPCGIDQEPHLEVAREVARKMNQIYGTDFPEVQRFATAGQYVPSLLGEGKMSKSVEGSSINLTDDLAIIQKKLARVPTDSGKGNIIENSSFPTTEEEYHSYLNNVGVVSAGVETLFELVEMFIGSERKLEYQKLYHSKDSAGIRYGEMKSEIAQAIYSELKPIQIKRAELEKNPDYVDNVIADGAQKARTIASQTLAEVKEKMGLK